MPDTLFPCPVPVRTHTHLANIISFHRVTHWLLLQLRAYRAPQTTMNRNGRRGSALRNYLLFNRAVKWMGLWLVPVRVSKHDELNWKLAAKKTRTEPRRSNYNFFANSWTSSKEWTSENVANQKVQPTVQWWLMDRGLVVQCLPVYWLRRNAGYRWMALVVEDQVPWSSEMKYKRCVDR